MTNALSPLSNMRYSFQNILMRTFMFGVVGSLAMFISSWEKTDRMKDRLFDRHRDYGDTFDFIVVGAGTAGAIVANRLSENYRVLLLEAGGDPHPFQSIPMFASYMLNYKELDWMHKTVPQKKACFCAQGGQAGISQGKALGGTSNTGYMHHLRGSPFDYDNWAGITGDTSWNYESLIPLFKKHEDYDGPWSKKDHGINGDMHLETPDYTGMANEFVAAGEEMGYKHTDLNGKFTEGFDTATYAMQRGYRRAIYSSFIKKNRPRWNLVIMKYSHVNRILMRGEDNSAYGVEYDRHGKRKYAYAKKEIIISGGAIQSPKLLMLSGIGPKQHLEYLGIPVKVDLPVGQNLQDHLTTFLGPFLIETPNSLIIDRDMTLDSLLKFASINSRGPLTTTGIQAAGLISSSRAKREGQSHWPDLQLSLYGMAHHQTSDEDFAHAYRIRKEITQQYFGPSKGIDSFSIIVSGGRPASRGQVLLQDLNPYSDAYIDPKYLERDSDMEVMVDGIRRAIFMVENTTTFQNMRARFTEELLPGCESYLFRSEAYWDCYVRHFSVSLGNVAGTVAMGRIDSQNSVVDSELRVKGVSRLRVIDASVMPTIVVSGTQAATILIGEKGADMITRFWGPSKKIPAIEKNYKNGFSLLPNGSFRKYQEDPEILIQKDKEPSVASESSNKGNNEDNAYNFNPIYETVLGPSDNTIKYSRSPVIDSETAKSFNQTNIVESTGYYPYAAYYPSGRSVIHIRGQNKQEPESQQMQPALESEQILELTTNTPAIDFGAHQDYRSPLMEDYFGEGNPEIQIPAQIEQVEEPEMIMSPSETQQRGNLQGVEKVISSPSTLYPTINSGELGNNNANRKENPPSTTLVYEDRLKGDQQEPEQQLISYPIEIVSIRSGNPATIQNHLPIVQEPQSNQHNPKQNIKSQSSHHNSQGVIRNQIPYPSLPPPTPQPLVSQKPSSYQESMNQIYRETLPMLSQRHKDNPITYYHQQITAPKPPRRFPIVTVTPAASRQKPFALRDDVAKLFTRNQVSHVAAQNSILFSTKPLSSDIHPQSSKQNSENLRQNVYKILYPDSPPTPLSFQLTSDRPNPFQTLFAPFSKLLEAPLKFVSDPLKFVSDPIKKIISQSQSYQAPTTTPTPPKPKPTSAPFSKLIQAPFNELFQGIRNILNLNKAPKSVDTEATSQNQIVRPPPQTSQTYNQNQNQLLRPPPESSQTYNTQSQDQILRPPSENAQNHYQTHKQNPHPSPSQFSHDQTQDSSQNGVPTLYEFRSNVEAPPKSVSSSPSNYYGYNTPEQSTASSSQISASTSLPQRILSFLSSPKPPTKNQNRVYNQKNQISTSSSTERVSVVLAPQSYYGYDPHITSTNNTFNYKNSEPAASESKSKVKTPSSAVIQNPEVLKIQRPNTDRPPKDYEFIENDSTNVGPGGKLSYETDSSAGVKDIQEQYSFVPLAYQNKNTNPANPEKLEDNLKIIYQPLQGEDPIKDQTLPDEVRKLLESQNLGEQSQVYVLVGNNGAYRDINSPEFKDILSLSNPKKNLGNAHNGNTQSPQQVFKVAQESQQQEEPPKKSFPKSVSDILRFSSKFTNPTPGDVQAATGPYVTSNANNLGHNPAINSYHQQQHHALPNQNDPSAFVNSHSQHQQQILQNGTPSQIHVQDPLDNFYASPWAVIPTSGGQPDNQALSFNIQILNSKKT